MGLAPTTILQIHRILSRALKMAVQRGYVARNVTALVDARRHSLRGGAADAQRGTCTDRVCDAPPQWHPMERGTCSGPASGRSSGLAPTTCRSGSGTFSIRVQLQRQRLRHGCDDIRAYPRSRWARARAGVARRRRLTSLETITYAGQGCSSIQNCEYSSFKVCLVEAGRSCAWRSVASWRSLGESRVRLGLLHCPVWIAIYRSL